MFTNGCFDILHRGHVHYLEQAAKLGQALVVGINSDASAKRLGKSKDRPINSLDDRMHIVAALEAVGLVIAFDDDTPLNLIKRIRPEYLVKGGDWPLDKIVGAKEVLDWGGHVESIPFHHQRSTTDLINRIRGHDQTA